jgi:hypothetical protein
VKLKIAQRGYFVYLWYYIITFCKINGQFPGSLGVTVELSTTAIPKEPISSNLPCLR